MASGKIALLLLLVLAVAYVADAEEDTSRKLLKRRPKGKRDFSFTKFGLIAKGEKGGRGAGHVDIHTDAASSKRGITAGGHGEIGAKGKGTTSRGGGIAAALQGKGSLAGAGGKVQTKKGSAGGGALALAKGKRTSSYSHFHASVTKTGKATASAYSRASTGSKVTKG